MRLLTLPFSSGSLMFEETLASSSQFSFFLLVVRRCCEPIFKSFGQFSLGWVGLGVVQDCLKKLLIIENSWISDGGSFSFLMQL